MLFDWLLNLTLVIVAVSIIGLLYRVIKGPSIPDRVVALDSIGINVICLVAIASVKMDTQVFLDVILLIGILSFIGTTSFAKFLERGEVIERDRRN